MAVGQGGDAGASEKYCSWIIEINYLHDHHHDQQNHLHDHHHDYENHLHNRQHHYHDHHGLTMAKEVVQALLNNGAGSSGAGCKAS